MKHLTIALMMGFAGTAFGKLKCHTPNHEKSITITDNKIVFHSDSTGFNSKRKISSTTKGIITRKLVSGGFRKTLEMDKKTYKIHVNDLSNLSSLNDYMTVSIRDSYKISYPLHCEQAK